jgi:hypothetical protein
MSSLSQLLLVHAAVVLIAACICFPSPVVSEQMTSQDGEVGLDQLQDIRGGHANAVLGQHGAGKPLHVVVISVPFYGHFMPLKAIAEQLALRGHRVTLLVENPDWCLSKAPMNCVTMQKSGTFPHSLFQLVSELEDPVQTWQPLVDELNVHHRTQLAHFLEVCEREFFSGGGGSSANGVGHQNQNAPDLFLIDSSTQVGFSVAHKYNIPIVVSNPMLTRQGIGETWLPALGTAHGRHQTTSQRMINFIIGLIVPYFAHQHVQNANQVRASFGIRPFHTIAEAQGVDTLCFTPTVWGYDIPQPLVPNFQPLGLIIPLEEVHEMEPELAAFLNSDECKSIGAIYINFGTLATPNDELIRKFITTFTKHQRRCLVWKITEQERRERVQKIFSAATADDGEGNASGRISPAYITKRFSSPVAIMSHDTVIAFVTHCGDTSLGEAIHAQVPLIGIPFFADQGDVCQRLHEVGIGVCLGHKHHFTVESLSAAVQSVFDSRDLKVPRAQDTKSSFVAQLKVVKKMASFYGGAAKGAKLVEQFATSKLLSVYQDPIQNRAGMFPLASPSLDMEGYWVYLFLQVVPWVLFWCGVYSVALKIFSKLGPRS